MADTGWVLVTVGENTTLAGDGSTWALPGNITADDIAIASSSLTSGALTNTLQGRGLGLDVPAGATIDGIGLRVRRHAAHNNRARDLNIRLTRDDGGVVLAGEDKGGAIDWPNSATTVDYGGEDDLWGTTWTPAQVNHAHFGGALRAQNIHGAQSTIARVEAMWLRVWYTEAGPIEAGVGSITVAGQEVNTLQVFVAGVGTVNASGQAAIASTAITPDHGTIAATGQDAIANAARVIEAGHGAVSVAGQAASGAADALIEAGVGAVTVAGQDASATTDLVSAPGVVEVFGQSAVVNASHVVLADQATITVVGMDAGEPIPGLQVLDGTGNTWNRVETGRTIAAGNWQAHVWIMRFGGSGTQEVRAQVHHRDAGCNIVETLIDEVIELTEDFVAEYSTSPFNPGLVTFAEGDFVTVELYDESGDAGKAVLFDFAPGGDGGDSRLAHPGEGAPPPGPGIIEVFGQAATVNARVATMVDTGLVAAMGQAAVVNAAMRLEAGHGAVAVAGQTAAANARTSIVAGHGAVAAAGQSATVNARMAIVAGHGAITVAGQQTVAVEDTFILPGFAAVTAAGQVVFINARTFIGAGVGVISLAGQEPEILAARIIHAGVGTITVNGGAASGGPFGQAGFGKLLTLGLGLGDH